MLTEILHIYNNTDSQQKVQGLIKALPKQLHRQRVSLSGLNIKSSGLCDLHRPMNADVLRDILNLVQREVTRCFHPFDRHPYLVRPIETYILSKLRALKGLWTKPVPGSPVAPGAWPYEINGCAACILARIAVNKEIVLLLRVALQSRTRTGKNHRPRRLMMFVDECMNRFSREDAEEIFSISSNLAYRMKDTRKACSKARGHHAIREGRRLVNCDREDVTVMSATIHGQDGDHDGDRVAIPEQNRLSPQGTYLSTINDIEWAVPSMLRSPGSMYSSSPVHHRGIEDLESTKEEADDDLANEESQGSEDECDSLFEDTFVEDRDHSV